MPPRASLNGQDFSGPATRLTKLIAPGQPFFDETNRRLWALDPESGLALPADRGYYASTSLPRLQVDDFGAGTINSNWSLNKGSNGSAANFAAVAANASIVKATTGAAGTGTAADCVAIGGQLIYDIANGAITMYGVVKVSAIANVALFVGLHDTLPASTLEMPFTLSGSTFTSTATDGCGFLFDTAATTDTIRCVSVKNDVDGTSVDSADAFAADTYRRFKITVDTSGNAKFFINGTLVGTITSAIRSGVNLCPIVAAESRTTSTRDVTVDLIAAA